MRLLLVCLALALGSCGSPMLHLIECPVGSGDRERVCTPYLEVLAERDGETYRFEGSMYALDLETRGALDRRVAVTDGRVEVLETGQVVEVGPDGAFALEGLEGRHTLEFTASGTRPIRRRVDRLYAEVRGR